MNFRFLILLTLFGLTIIVKPNFCYAEIANIEPFSKVVNSIPFPDFQYGFEPVTFIEKNNMYVISFSDDNKEAILYKYNFLDNLLTMSKTITKNKIDLKSAKLIGGIYGFFVKGNYIVMQCCDKLLLYKKYRDGYIFLESKDIDCRNILTDGSGYFVIYRYSNDFFKEKKKIEVRGFSISNDKLKPIWEYKEEYKDIYYSHINGNYADLNQNGEFILTYPSKYQILVFNKNGGKISLSKDLKYFPNYSILEEQRKLFSSQNKSLKEKISVLIQNEKITNRIQTIRFLDSNRFMVIRLDSSINNEFRRLDIWTRSNATSSFNITKFNMEYRDEFSHETRSNETNYYWMPCFRCTNKKFIRNGNIFLWEMYVPKEYLFNLSYKEYEDKLNEYYKDKNIIYGFYQYKINENLLK